MIRGAGLAPGPAGILVRRLPPRPIENNVLAYKLPRRGMWMFGVSDRSGCCARLMQSLFDSSGLLNVFVAKWFVEFWRPENDGEVRQAVLHEGSRDQPNTLVLAYSRAYWKCLFWTAIQIHRLTLDSADATCACMAFDGSIAHRDDSIVLYATTQTPSPVSPLSSSYPR